MMRRCGTVDERLLGTARVESDLRHRRQIGGPALGLFQMEPATHNDIWESYLKYRAQLAERVQKLLTSEKDDKLVETHCVVVERYQNTSKMARGDGMKATPVRKGVCALAITLFMFFLASVVAATTIHAQNAPREATIAITADDIVSIDRPKEIPRSKFDDDYWGQFQVLIPKERFPVPAPNCKKNVIFRMTAVAPDDPSRSAKLSARWDLFQSLHAVREGEKESILVRVASGPYMKTRKDGTRVLEYCNAFIKLE